MAVWLRQLIGAGVLPLGDVDERSIEDVRPSDLKGYSQCHFFAGLGGWAYALDLAGWPRDRPVWTGSCPCQPFSAAGKGAGFEDERHLWPAWQHLIAQCKPAVVFGEQVASHHVGPWIDLVQSDVEGLGYAFGGVAFPAAGVGAQFIGDRLYWVATEPAEAKWNQQSREEPCSWKVGRMGRVKQSVPWHMPWQDALPGLRALDDGLPRCVAGTDAARNAIVPQQAAAFVRAYQ